jgi:conjugal transfer pilin signal peptidase TrbI
MKKFRILTFVLAFVLMSSLATPLFGVRYTVSPSLPYKLFISRPSTQIHKNQYVTFEHPQSAILVAKQVIGVAGDHIAIHDQHLYVNEQDYGLILETSKSGLKLHPISDGEIPEGYLFAYAPHQESFDSRYQEFGLISTEQVREVLWPLF